MMKRDECLALIEKHRGNAVIVAHFQPAFDLMRMAPNPLNYYAVGAMGQGSSHGLGLALGMPERKIIVLDGDGSLLMNLGTLVTIANAAPPNLYHFLFANGTYETNGSHPVPGAGKTDFAGLAIASGYRRAETVSDLNALGVVLPDLLETSGPVFAVFNICPGQPSPQDWAFVNGAATREEFRSAITRP